MCASRDGPRETKTSYHRNSLGIYINENRQLEEKRGEKKFARNRITTYFFVHDDIYIYTFIYRRVRSVPGAAVIIKFLRGRSPGIASPDVYDDIVVAKSVAQ